jgi:hypothetical protein
MTLKWNCKLIANGREQQNRQEPCMRQLPSGNKYRSKAAKDRKCVLSGSLAQTLAQGVLLEAVKIIHKTWLTPPQNLSAIRYIFTKLCTKRWKLATEIAILAICKWVPSAQAAGDSFWDRIQRGLALPTPQGRWRQQSANPKKIKSKNILFYIEFSFECIMANIYSLANSFWASNSC